MNWEKVLSEFTFRTSRSSGAGGQHVNKTETKVEVLFSIRDSEGLTQDEKEILYEKLATALTEEGSIAVSSQKTRSQFDNKENAIEKLKMKLEKALMPKAKRISTKPSKASVEERLAEKKLRSEKKMARKKPEL